jgi:hypothetical protein
MTKREEDTGKPCEKKIQEDQGENKIQEGKREKKLASFPSTLLSAGWV